MMKPLETTGGGVGRGVTETDAEFNSHVSANGH